MQVSEEEEREKSRKLFKEKIMAENFPHSLLKSRKRRAN